MIESQMNTTLGARKKQGAITIRNETGSDAEAISKVTEAAFRMLKISKHTEPLIIEALRAAKALAVSLVAERNGAMIGHIAFSPVVVSDGTTGWYGLGPVSVLPEYQRQGAGKALIRDGLSRLQAIGAQGCCLVGHPGYYRKFEFRNPAGLAVNGVPPEFFFARFHRALSARHCCLSRCLSGRRVVQHRITVKRPCGRMALTHLGALATCFPRWARGCVGG